MVTLLNDRGSIDPKRAGVEKKSSYGLDFGGVLRPKISFDPLDPLELTSLPQDYVGVLGTETFAKGALGFDLSSRTMVVWDKAAAGEAEAWCGALSPLPGLPSLPVRWVSLPLGVSESGGYTIAAKIDGHPATLSLGTSTTLNLFDSAKLNADAPVARSTVVRTFDGAPDRPSQFVATSLEIEGIEPFLALGTREISEPGAPSNGVLCLANLPTRRVVVDFANKRLFMERLSPDAARSVVLTGLLKFPVVIDGDVLRVAPAAPGHPEAFQTIGGHEILDIADIKASDLVKAIRKGGPEALILFAVIERASGEGYKARIQLDGGIYILSVTP